MRKIVHSPRWRDYYVHSSEDAEKLEKELRSSFVPEAFLNPALNSKITLVSHRTKTATYASINRGVGKKLYRLDFIVFENTLITINYDNFNTLSPSSTESPIEELFKIVLQSYNEIRQEFEAKVHGMYNHATKKVNDEIFEDLLELMLELGHFYRTCTFLHTLLIDDIISLFQDKDAASAHLRILDQCMETSKELKQVITEAVALQTPIIQHQMNEGMKKLAVVSIIFMPLTFLASIYGMNLNMPEVMWKYGYHAFWVSVFIITGFVIWILKRNNLI